MHTPAWIRTFASVDALLRYVEGPDEETNPRPVDSRDSHSDDTGFTGTKTWDEAVALARAGWADGAHRMARSFAEMQDRLYMRGMVQVPALCADQPGPLDIGRYAQGRPDCLYTWTDSEEVRWGARGVVTIAVNIGASSGVSTEAIFRKGAVAGCLIDALERAGRRVEVKTVAATAARPGGNPNLVEIRTIKDPQDTLDLDRLAFHIAHPSSLRRLNFAVGEHASRAIREQHNIPGNYGYPAEYEPADTDIYIAKSFLGEFGSDAASAAEWVKQQLIAQGVRIDTGD